MAIAEFFVLTLFTLLTFVFVGVLFVDFINFLRKYPPFFPSRDSEFKSIYRFIDKNANYSIVDLGAGDARVLIDLANNTNFKLTGFEINPFISLLAKIRIKKLKLQDKIKIHNQNFLKTNFSDYDLFYIYGINKIMPEVENKLLNEAKKGTYVVSNKFTFENLEHIVTYNKIHLYKV